MPRKPHPRHNEIVQLKGDIKAVAKYFNMSVPSIYRIKAQGLIKDTPTLQNNEAFSKIVDKNDSYTPENLEFMKDWIVSELPLSKKLWIARWVLTGKSKNESIAVMTSEIASFLSI